MIAKFKENTEEFAKLNCFYGYLCGWFVYHSCQRKEELLGISHTSEGYSFQPEINTAIDIRMNMYQMRNTYPNVISWIVGEHNLFCK